MSESSCFLYFVEFSSCLQQTDNSGSCYFLVVRGGLSVIDTFKSVFGLSVAFDMVKHNLLVLRDLVS